MTFFTTLRFSSFLLVSFISSSPLRVYAMALSKRQRSSTLPTLPDFVATVVPQPEGAPDLVLPPDLLLTTSSSQKLSSPTTIPSAITESPAATPPTQNGASDNLSSTSISDGLAVVSSTPSPASPISMTTLMGISIALGILICLIVGGVTFLYWRRTRPSPEERYESRNRLQSFRSSAIQSLEMKISPYTPPPPPIAIGFDTYSSSTTEAEAPKPSIDHPYAYSVSSSPTPTPTLRITSEVHPLTGISLDEDQNAIPAYATRSPVSTIRSSLGEPAILAAERLRVVTPRTTKTRLVAPSPVLPSPVSPSSTASTNGGDVAYMFTPSMLNESLLPSSPPPIYSEWTPASQRSISDWNAPRQSSPILQASTSSRPSKAPKSAGGFAKTRKPF